MIATILRYFSYGYNLIIAAGMLVLGLIANLSNLDLKLDMLPWSGPELTYWLIGLGVAGLVSLGLSVMGGIFRWALVLWSVLILGLWIRAIYSPGWTFDGQQPFNQALLGLGAYAVSVLGAFLGAWRGK